VAMTVAKRFSIITTLPRSVPIIEDLVHEYGAQQQCRKVRSINMPVLALEENPEQTRMLLAEEIERAKAEDQAEAIILGCAGMAELCAQLEAQCGVPVIDGVSAAVKLAEALVSGGYRTAKTGAYAYPRLK
jgi:allantoin racemase